MQSVIQLTQQDHSSTIRRTSLKAEARANRDAALAAWENAYNAWKESPTIPNQNALRCTSVAYDKAQTLYDSVRTSAKYNKGTVAVAPAEVLHV